MYIIDLSSSISTLTSKSAYQYYSAEVAIDLEQVQDKPLSQSDERDVSYSYSIKF
jgi:hypothetical protein